MKLGRYYLIDFLDHSMGLNKLVKCRIAGRLVLSNEKEVKVLIWQCLNLRGDEKSSNEENISIVKSTILKFKELK